MFLVYCSQFCVAYPLIWVVLLDPVSLWYQKRYIYLVVWSTRWTERQMPRCCYKINFFPCLNVSPNFGSAG